MLGSDTVDPGSNLDLGDPILRKKPALELDPRVTAQAATGESHHMIRHLARNETRRR